MATQVYEHEEATCKSLDEQLKLAQERRREAGRKVDQTARQLQIVAVAKYEGDLIEQGITLFGNKQ
jgi:hypothetical protein